MNFLAHLVLSPKDRVAQFYRGLILSSLGEYEEALLIFQELINTSENHWQIPRISAEIEAITRIYKQESTFTHQ